MAEDPRPCAERSNADTRDDREILLKVSEADVQTGGGAQASPILYRSRAIAPSLSSAAAGDGKEQEGDKPQSKQD